MTIEHNSFLNNVDADEDFFNDSLTYNNFTSNCKPFSFEQLNEFNIKDKNNLVILKIKVRSFNCNFDKLTLLFRNQQDYPNTLILTDTWFTCDNVCDLEGY